VGINSNQLCGLAESVEEDAAAHDVTVGDTVKLEVKSSKVQRVTASGGHRRWQWTQPEGFRDKGKGYDFLLRIGDSDRRFESQYPDGPGGSPYVFFLVPHDKVQKIVSHGPLGSQVFLNTNLAGIRATSKTSLELTRYLVPMKIIEELVAQAVEP
jgi:hypothetical protein